MISGKIKKLWSQFRDKEYRDGFVADALADGLAIQIYNMRTKNDWTQAELAEKVGTKQAAVCKWENGDSPRSLTTLAKIASAFDVALIVKFVPFSEFLKGDGQPFDRPMPNFEKDNLDFRERRSGRTSDTSNYIIYASTEFMHHDQLKINPYTGSKDQPQMVLQ
jgi:transcriptional regulator with XRE-family HTH domain